MERKEFEMQVTKNGNGKNRTVQMDIRIAIITAIITIIIAFSGWAKNYFYNYGSLNQKVSNINMQLKLINERVEENRQMKDIIFQVDRRLARIEGRLGITNTEK